MCVKHSALVIRLKRGFMCWPVLPYKRLVCLCGVSGDCIEVYDGFVHRAAPAHTEVYGGNLCVVRCCGEVTHWSVLSLLLLRQISVLLLLRGVKHFLQWLQSVSFSLTLPYFAPHTVSVPAACCFTLTVLNKIYTCHQGTKLASAISTGQQPSASKIWKYLVHRLHSLAKKQW